MSLVSPPERSRSARWILFVAQGFGSGWAPVAPGTFGSVVGVLWFLALAAAGSWWVLVLGTLAGLGLSVWCCGRAEKILGKTDPGSVVLDEISALPLCFFSWVALHTLRSGSFPAVSGLCAGWHWVVVAGVFAAFRFFDILKPWPVRQSQSLPGGGE